LRKQIKEKKKEEKKPQKIREEVIKLIGTFYIELLTSRPPPTFQESNESFGEERNVERKILKALTTIEKGFEETLRNF